MACGPKLLFLEHFTMELHRESAANLLEKLLNYKLCLLGSICQSAPGFVLSKVVRMFHDIDVEVVEQHEEGQVCTKNEHFINPPMFCFCNDSPSVMVKLHKECLKTKEFTFAYGCAPHAIHNLCMDLIKNFPGVKHVLKQIVFMVKTLKSSHLLLQLFNKLCLEKFKKTYVLILFTKTRWGIVFFTAQCANTVKAPCTTLLGEILNAELDIDICDELKVLVIDLAYWKGVVVMEMFFMTISSCLTYLEGDEATFSAVYACFVAIKYHIKMFNCAVMDTFNLGDDDIELMMTLLHYRFSIIYLEAHGLAFATDPMFIDMCSKIVAKFGKYFLQVGKGSINQQAKATLVRLSNGNENLWRSYFSEFTMLIMRLRDNDYDFNNIKFKPSELWTLCDNLCYGSIKGLLSALHNNRVRASAFTVVHAFDWAMPNSRRGSPFCSTQSSLIVELPQHGI